MPRPKSLSAPQIAGAALAVVDRDGLTALSMRAVAAELGTSAMALYRYVQNRDQLEQWIVDHVLDTVDHVPPATVAWQEQVVVLMERVRDAVAAHPAAVPLFLTHRHSSPASLRWIEAMLATLTDGGITGAARAIAQRSLVAYLLGSLQIQHLGPLAGAGTATLAALPDTDFPYVAATAQQARHIAPREEFVSGLAVILRGLDAEPS